MTGTMAPKVMRRPAGAAKAKAEVRNIGRMPRGGNPGRRRPAALADGDHHPERIEEGAFLVGEEAHYYGQRGSVAGQVVEEKEEDGRRMISINLSGTTIDPLLQWATCSFMSNLKSIRHNGTRQTHLRISSLTKWGIGR